VKSLSPFTNGIVSASALIALGIFLGRDGGSKQSAGEAAPEPLDRAEWQALTQGAAAIGSTTAPHVILVFSDFQCPYCATFAATIHELQARHPDRVRLVVRHFPLETIHPHARAAALASECAREQGRFQDYHDALFKAQPEIGVRTWEHFASTARVPDIAAFQSCMVSGKPLERIKADIAWGERLGVQGTPTIYVNGVLLQGAPTLQRLEQLTADNR
jgi:protein-disulfide isomerase